VNSWVGVYVYSFILCFFFGWEGGVAGEYKIREIESIV
jgi:hypothetical protein